jgi:hypothetical protein
MMQLMSAEQTYFDLATRIIDYTVEVERTPDVGVSGRPRRSCGRKQSSFY